MSPREAHRHVDARRFPRVSGDEPALGLIALVIAAFSPRERG